MNNKPNLDHITFSFSQEPNCVDGGEVETLEVRVESSLGVDYDEGGFFVIKTEQWAFDDITEFSEMMQRVQNAVDTLTKNKKNKK
jgi:hypothetical protein